MDGLLKQQIITFILCFLTSLFRHSMLESWSIVKPQISDDLNFSSLTLGVIDTIFVFFYSLGNIVLGHVSDIYSPKLILCGSMILSSFAHISVLLMALSLYKAAALYGIFIIINGFFQGAIWVCCVSIMGNWYSTENRGKVMGVWIVNSSLGNIFGSQVASGMVSAGVEWQLTLVLFIYLFVAVVFLNLKFLKEKPIGHVTIEHPKPASVSYALKLPGVLAYSIAFFCIKMSHYSLVLWLPSYIYKKLHESEYEGGALASLYDIGGVVGCILIGWVSDKISARIYVFFPLTIGSLPLLLSFTLGSKSTIWVFYLLIPLVGFILTGVNLLICSAVAADLGQNCDKKHDARTTVVGIIEGFGGFGAALGQIIIGELVKSSWDNVFYFCFAVTLFSVFAMVPIVVNAVKGSNNEINEVEEENGEKNLE